MFTLTIETGNSAFDDDRGAELARILRNLADKLEDGYTHGVVLDMNGNTVGQFYFGE